MTPQEKRAYLMELIEKANGLAEYLSAEFKIIKKFKSGNLQIQLYSASERWANEVYDLRVSKKTVDGNPLLMIRDAEKRDPDYAERPWPYWTYFHETNQRSPDNEDATYLGTGESLLRLTWTPH